MNGLPRRAYRIQALLFMALASSGAFAADLSRARNCSRILDANARLACFDAIFGAPTGGSPVEGVVVAPTASPGKPADKVAQFGDRGQLPAEKAARDDLPKRINFKVVKSEELAHGLFRLTMDNGQVWMTKEADWALDFRTGDDVTIQRMVLGGFRVSHTGQGRNVTVARVQ